MLRRRKDMWFNSFALVLILVAAPSSGSEEISVHAESGLSDNTQSIAEAIGFRTALLERQMLDQKEAKQKEPKADIKALFKKYEKWKRKQSSRSVESYHDRVRCYCRYKRRGGCSQQEAYLLLVKEQEAEQSAALVGDYAYASKSAVRPGQATCEELHRAPTATEFFENYVKKSRPVIFRGLASQWPAVSKRKWTLPYLQKKAGTSRVRIFVSPSRDFEAPMTMGDYRRLAPRFVTNMHEREDQAIGDEEMILMRPAESEVSFNDYVYLTTTYENKEKAVFYFQKHDIYKWREFGLLDDLLPSLFDDNANINSHTKMKSNSKSKSKRKKSDIAYGNSSTSSDAWARFLAMKYHFLWMGYNSTRGNLHYDPEENLFAVIRGRKTFDLYHPFNDGMYEREAIFRSAHFLYSWSNNSGGVFYSLPVSATTQSYQPFSPVNTTHPDREKHPLFSPNSECRSFLFLKNLILFRDDIL